MILELKNLLLASIINDFDLFTVEDGYLSSESIARRLELRDAKSEQAREIVKLKDGVKKYDKRYERNTKRYERIRIVIL